jgi:hypothetical protein
VRSSWSSLDQLSTDYRFRGQSRHRSDHAEHYREKKKALRGTMLSLSSGGKVGVVCRRSAAAPWWYCCQRIARQERPTWSIGSSLVPLGLPPKDPEDDDNEDEEDDEDEGKEEPAVVREPDE